MKQRRSADAEKFADEICDGIFKALKKRPNEIFRVECIALGRLVADGSIDRVRAKEAMVMKFAAALGERMDDLKKSARGVKNAINS